MPVSLGLVDFRTAGVESGLVPAFEAVERADGFGTTRDEDAGVGCDMTSPARRQWEPLRSGRAG